MAKETVTGTKENKIAPETVTSSDAKSTDVGAPQNDFEMRSKQAADEIRKILDTYKVDIGTEMIYTNFGISSKPVFVEMQPK